MERGKSEVDEIRESLTVYNWGGGPKAAGMRDLEVPLVP